MFGSTCEYVSRVMAMVACPSISETIFGFTLRVSSSVAHVCQPKRMHWKTYERLWWEHHEAEMEQLEGMRAWLDKLERKVG
jgi:hypothetical protein